MSEVIEIKNLSKQYDLGLVGTGTLSKDLNRLYAKVVGRPDPYATIAELNDRTSKNKSGTVYALKDINFSVNKGEVLGIIGGNGAGKSTLLKILSQITSPSTGEINIKGRVASLLEVGTGMHPEMTARQNIYLNGALMGMRKFEIKNRLDEIVDFAGILKYVDTPIKRFSSGMQVRLGFAVAAFLEPEILIVDEVLAVGDAEFQKKAIGKMKDVSSGQGRTVLFVSHNMTSVKSLCDKGIILENGISLGKGEIDEIVEKYINRSIKKTNEIFVNKSQGDKTTYIKKCQILSKSKTGGKFTLNIEINSLEELNIEIAFGFRLNDGSPLLHVHSSHNNTMLKVNKGLNIFNVEIENLLLTPGWYTLNIWIGQGKIELDYHTSCLQLLVKDGALSEGSEIIKYQGYHNIQPANWTKL